MPVAMFSPQARPAAPARLRSGTACPRHVRVVVAAHPAKTPIPTGYLGDLRRAAIKLHSRQQMTGGKKADVSPADVKAAEAEDAKRQQMQPKVLGYLRYLQESKIVWNFVEETVANSDDPTLAQFKNTGLERSATLEKDLQWFAETKGLQPLAAKPDGPGNTYKRYLEALLQDDVPAFMCHYYNINFAHTAGGRMIGTAVSNALFEGHEFEFYKYEGGDPKEIGNGVKDTLQAVAETWTEEDRKRSVDQTADSFKMAGSMMRCITQSCDCDCPRA